MKISSFFILKKRKRSLGIPKDLDFLINYANLFKALAQRDF